MTAESLAKLPIKQQAAFAAYLCERMLPNYQLFSQQSQWGDPSILRGALDVCWEKITHNKNSQWARWAEKLSEVNPTPEQFDQLGVYPANAACTALQCLLQAFSEKDEQAFFDVAQLSKSSLAHYLELGVYADLPSLAAREAAIQTHALWEYEQAIQASMLDYLTQSQSTPLPELAKTLRQIVREEGHSNLGLSLSST